ncbi:hypothetical protein [Marinitoga lauensis]|nr:hypothetical protein [Marinitoga lauensis]
MLFPPYEKDYPLVIEYEKEIVSIDEGDELAMPGLDGYLLEEVL